MRFADMRNARHSGAVHRARSVVDLVASNQLDAESWTHSGAVVWSPDADVRFDAHSGHIIWEDADGETRVMELPDGITTESVAGILLGLDCTAREVWQRVEAL